MSPGILNICSIVSAGKLIERAWMTVPQSNYFQRLFIKPVYFVHQMIQVNIIVFKVGRPENAVETRINCFDNIPNVATAMPKKYTAGFSLYMFLCLRKKRYNCTLREHYFFQHINPPIAINRFQQKPRRR